MAKIEAIYLSPGHNFVGHHGREPGRNPMIEVDRIECVAGRGLRGDRFFDHRENFKGQLTLFSSEVLEDLRGWLGLDTIQASSLRRNLLVRDLNLTACIGQRFTLQGIELEGTEECRPCYWMDRVLGDGVETWLQGRGGLRCRILGDGWLQRDPAPSASFAICR